MGKFYDASVSVTDPAERATSISNWFNNLEGISSEVIDYEYDDNTYKAANIVIDGTDISILFGIKSDAVGTSVVHAYNGEDKVLISDTYATGNDGNTTAAKLYAYIDDNCIMLSVCQSNSTANGVEIIYVKTADNKYLVGYYRHSTQNVYFVDISSLTFEEINDSARLIHSYTNMFPFAAILGQVDFLNQAYFVQANPGVSNAYKSFKVDILKECSTVTLLSTVSLPYPLNNHLAIGAHCIVPLDDEEEVNE
jgi:hypothetical protein